MRSRATRGPLLPHALGVALAVARKDLRTEWRGRELLPALGQHLFCPLDVTAALRQRFAAVHDRRISCFAERFHVGGAWSIRFHHVSVFRFLA